ncbi:TPA: IS21 family transposase [Legionella pneumophila]|nr:IS21 family transposase [Legionella pneumophila]
MPAEKLSMRKIKEVLKLHYEGVSNREIADRVRIGSGSVSRYLARAKAARLVWPLMEEWTEERIYKVLFPTINKNSSHPVPDFVRIHKELKRKGVTLMLLWYEYQSQNPGGYSYSRYCGLYQEFSGKLNPAMRLTHLAGEKLFVDYSGLTVPWIDKLTGEVHRAQIFVAVLGASNYTFIEATPDQSIFSWIQSHVHAFEFFAGAPVCLVPDNLKSGVTKSHLYDPDINRTYQELADHYGVAVVPARVRAPKDKSKVEVGVQGIQRWILAPLRDITFFSVHDINKAIQPLLEAYNKRPFYELEGTRLSQYLETDKPALKPLPLRPYTYAEWKKARSGADYHVAIDKHYYSIPHRYLKEGIDIRMTLATVECFHKGNRIAIHPRSYRPGHTTLREHMPRNHQDYAEWTPERMQAWAKTIGPNTGQLIKALTDLHKIPEQSFRGCLGILRMSKTYGNERLENAAIRALYIGAIRYKNIESILKSGLDQQPLPLLAGESIAAEPTRLHDNIRGSKYFH